MRLFQDGRRARVALAGSGYISAGLLRTLARFEDVTVSAVLSSRDPARHHDYPLPELLVRDIDQLIAGCDVVVECSGRVTRAMRVADAALAAGLPVVTVNAEFQVTVGHLYVHRGCLTEAEGDQPGALAAMAEEITLMGFQPLVYGNVKTFLDPDPSVDNMRRQAALHGISEQQVTSFTDGTKLHVELALVANGLGAVVTPGGPCGVRGFEFTDSLNQLGELARQVGAPISDYCMPTRTNAHVFIVATGPHDVADQLAHYKLGRGPLYHFTRDRHLGHFEVPRTIKRVLETRQVLINNGKAPTVSVAAVTKRPVPAGTTIDAAVGSRLFRGICMPAQQTHLVPIGLLEGAVTARNIAAGTLATVDEVHLDETLAAQLTDHGLGQAVQ